MSEYFDFQKRKPIDYLSLATKATDMLRSMIITGECPQGARITEANLSDAIGVSRACVREAFIALEKEGLLIKAHNRYTEVVKFTEKDAEDICSLRVAIETMALQNCMENGALDLEAMITAADELYRKLEKIQPDEVIHWLEDDMSFHREIMIAAGNIRALYIWDGLRNQIVAMLYMACRLFPDILTPSLSHRQLIESLKSKDFQKGSDLLKNHILKSMERIKKGIASKS